MSDKPHIKPIYDETYFKFMSEQQVEEFIDANPISDEEAAKYAGLENAIMTTKPSKQRTPNCEPSLTPREQTS